jgi:hypothetical protein
MGTSKSYKSQEYRRLVLGLRKRVTFVARPAVKVRLELPRSTRVARCRPSYELRPTLLA